MSFNLKLIKLVAPGPPNQNVANNGDYFSEKANLAVNSTNMDISSTGDNLPSHQVNFTCEL